MGNRCCKNHSLEGKYKLSMQIIKPFWLNELKLGCLLSFRMFFSNYVPQFSSVAQLCPTLWNPMNHSTPGLPVHHQLPEFTQLMSVKSVIPSSHLIICCPLLLPPVPPSIRVFSTESTLRMRWPKYWSFSFSISPSKIMFLVRFNYLIRYLFTTIY